MKFVITDLRNTNEISDTCHAVKEPIFITKNGYGDLVVMSSEIYEHIAETQFIDNAITETEEEDEKQRNRNSRKNGRFIGNCHVRELSDE